MSTVRRARATATVVWHDLECGGYQADLGLWRALAAGTGGPVLDIGAGTGRVALPLACDGHAVTALDHDRELLEELERRRGSLPITTVAADARDFDLGRRFRLCIVPMQTIHLLGGADGRLRFLSAARRHLDPGGLAGIALVEKIELFDAAAGAAMPPAESCRRAGATFASQPVAVRREARGFLLERLRTHTVQGDSSSQLTVVRLDDLDADRLEAEARAAGLAALGRTSIPPTQEHSGSLVVMLGG